MMVRRVATITTSVIGLVGNSIFRQGNEFLVVQRMVVIDRDIQIGFRWPLRIEASNAVVGWEFSDKM